MKKRIVLLTCGVLLGALLFTGCGENEEISASLQTEPSETSTVKPSTKREGVAEEKVATDQEKQITEGFVLAFMNDGKWNNDTDYVYDLTDITRILDEEKKGGFSYCAIVDGFNFTEFNLETRFNNIPYWEYGDVDVITKQSSLYGIYDDWWKQHDEADLMVSEVYYDEASNKIYSHGGIVFDMSCMFASTYVSDEGKRCFEYSVSNDIEDGTRLKGIITLTYSADDNGEVDMFEGATYKPQ